MIVGLTGGIGSGKTTVANFFSKYTEVAVFIADVEAKKMMNTSKEIKEKLIQEFGPSAFVENKLNRKYLADIVFSDKGKLKKINEIVHPEVKKGFQNFVKINSDKAYVLYENAILFESNSDEFCDKIITVIADKRLRMQRVMQRDHASNKQILDRMKNQWSDEKKLLLSNYIILNDQLEKTKHQVDIIHKILTKNHLRV